MSVQMKLGRWREIMNARKAFDDVLRFKDSVEPLSPTPASAEAGPACDSTSSAKKTLAMMRHEYNALDRWLNAYRALVAQNERAKSDLEEAIKRLEKEVEG